MSRLNRVVFIALAASLAPVSLLAQTSPGVRANWVIEGMANGSMEMTLYATLGDVAKTRVEMGTPQSVIISNGDARIILMPAQKMWMDLSEMEAFAGRMGMPPGGQRAADEDVPEMEATGETGSFAGESCKYYRFTRDDVVTDICAATGFGWSMGPGAGGGLMGRRGGAGRMGAPGGLGGTSSMSAERYQELRRMFADGFFPLEVRQTRNGERTMRMYATDVEQTDLDDSLFATTAPEGYQKMPLMGGRGRGGR
ncbi:MAG: hypothetical protein PVH00_07150 [Gemmatimonadota bacterium]